MGLASGTNLYAYALGNPVTATDPFGLAVTLYCGPIGYGGTNRLWSFLGSVGYKHCFVRVQCDCPQYDYKLEATSRNDATGMATIPPPQKFFFGHGGSIVPFNPPDFDSQDCKMEDCVLQRYKNLQAGGYAYPITGPRFGPNSNTFARDLLTGCGVTKIEWPTGVFPFAPLF